MSYDLAFWEPVGGTEAAEAIYQRLIDDDPAGLPSSRSVSRLRARILRAHPDWRDGVLVADGDQEARYLLLTIPWSWATTASLNPLREWAAELTLVMFDPQLGQVLGPDNWYEDDDNDGPLPTPETMRQLANALAALCRPLGFARVGRRLDWRREPGARAGFDVSTDYLTGETIVSSFALAACYAEMDEAQLLSSPSANTIAWRGPEVRMVLPNDEPGRADGIATLVAGVRDVLLPELDRATDEWVYNQLLEANQEAHVDVWAQWQLLIWAAVLGQTSHAEESARRLLEENPDSWGEIMDVHDRYGGFRPPPRPEPLPTRASDQ